MDEPFTIQKAKEAIIAEREDLALDLLAPLAQQGDPDAQFLYGVLSKSTFWIRASAGHNHPEACYFLACAAPTPDGFEFHAPVNDAGWVLLHKAAELKSIAARTGLGRFYIEGAPGLAPNPEKGLQLLSRIARMKRRYGCHEAAYHLSIFLLEGSRVPQEIKEGMEYLWKCAYGYPDKTIFSLQAAKLGYEIASQELYGQSQHNQQEYLEFLNQHEKLAFPPKWMDILINYSKNTLVYRLKGASVTAFANFRFDHVPYDQETYKEENRKFRWDNYWRVKFDPVHLITLYTQLFRDPAFLMERFTQEQLETGLWVMLTYVKHWEVSKLLSNSRIPLSLREECIRSMYDLHEKLFAVIPVNHACIMWWDALMMRRIPEDADNARLLDVILETLTRILNLESLDCKAVALHGLGHLDHPGKVPVLEKFIENPPETGANWREYAQACITGKIM